ncbi:hypothetical protein [Plantactinospora sp. CA-290183]|uniref:hypothetical protein n=1 Tax=Plantactinospora sp. CA-290183 TaxID=3240006 RepID=UPI003D8E9C6F
MTRSIRGARRATVVLAGTAVATTLLLSGCGAGQIAETAARQPTTVGANAQTADNLFKVRNLFIDYLNTTGYPAGGNAPVSVALFNDSGVPVTVRVSAEGAQSVVLAGQVSGTPMPVGTLSGGPVPSGAASVTPSASPSATPGEPAGSPSASPEGSPSGSPSAAGSASPSAQAPAGAPPEVQIPAGSFIVLTRTLGSWLQLNGLAAPLPPGASIPMTFDFNGAQVVVAAPVAVPQTPAPVATPEAEVGGGHGDEG